MLLLWLENKGGKTAAKVDGRHGHCAIHRPILVQTGALTA